MVTDNNRAASLYFIAVHLVCSFVMLNVFVGIIIDSYNDLKAETDGSVLMTEGQRRWVETMKMAAHAKPSVKAERPKSAFRGRAYDLVT